MSNKVGALIRSLRLDKQMTQKQLADRMNISDKTVSKWERGLGMPEISLIYLGVSRKSIRKSREKFQSLFENMKEGFAIHEMIFDEAGIPIDYRFLEVNESFEMFTGLSGNRVKGKSVKEVMPMTEDYWIERYGKIYR